jgi:DNA-binding NtrC family response regulator
MMNTMRVLVIGGSDALAIPESATTGILEQLRITRKPSLAEGLDALQESLFQLVLLDLSLPDTSASESVAKILRMARDLPVIAFLNDGETAKDVEVLCGGKQDYVVSECQSDRLIRTIRYAIERKQLIVDREAGRRLLTRNNEQLIAHLSHEIRNALTCIFQFGNILIGGLTGDLSEEQREYLGIMIENASRIRGALDGLTEVAPAAVGECADKNEPLPSEAN